MTGKWGSASNGIYHLTTRQIKGVKVVDDCDWTVLVMRDRKHSPVEANELAHKVAVLLNYGQRLVNQVEAMAGEGIQFTELEDPAELIMEMRADLVTPDHADLQGVFNFD